MKKLVQISIPLAILIFAGCHGFGFGCHGYGVRGSGVSKQETRTLEDFDAIEVGGAYDIDVVNGQKPSIELSGDDNILPLILTEVRGNTLHIYNKKSINARKKIRLKISVEDLQKMDVSGACNINVSEINNAQFRVDASGAGKMYLSGKTDELSLDLSGAVKINAKDLVSGKADVEISGASKAEVYASDDLRAEISGVGNLDYYGNPKNVRRSVSGVGSINQR